MSKVSGAIREIRHMDEIAAIDQWVRCLHPLVKLLLTIGYIALVVSFNKYDLAGLAAMAIYPYAVFQLSELSFRECLQRLRILLPIVCAVGLINPFLDTTLVRVGGVVVRAGVLSMLTLMLKGVLAVLGSYLLIATTSIEEICYALRLLHVPTLLVTQILLTYRYITVLLAEVERITQAYSLRAPRQKGVHFKVWGSLTGQLLLRAIDRADKVYESMTLRGYTGEFRYVGAKRRFGGRDALYAAVWTLALVGLRSFPVLRLLGNLVGGLR